MDTINLLILISFILNASLSLFLFSRSIKFDSISSRYFAYFGFAVSLWSLAMFFFRSVSIENSVLWSRLLYISASFIPSLFLLFNLSFFDQVVRKQYKYLIISINIIICLIVLEPNFITNVGEVLGSEIEINFGLYYYIVYLPYIPVMFLMSFFILIKKLTETQDENQRNQIIFILIGTLLSSNIGMLTNLILPTLNDFRFNWLGQVSTFIWLSFVSYSILRYRLFDVRVILGRLVYYSILSLILFVSFYFFINLNTILFGSLFSRVALIGGVFFSFGFALVYNYLNRLIHEEVKSSLINPGFDTKLSLNTFNIKTNGLLELKDILGVAFEISSRSLRPDTQYFIINKKKAKIKFLENNDIDINVIDIEMFINLWSDSKGKKTVNIEMKEFQLSYDFQNHKLLYLNCVDALERSNLTLAAPITSSISQEVIGVYFIGARERGSFSDQTILKYVQDLCSSIAVAIDRTFLYEEVKAFNKSLRHKIDEATQELQVKNDLLQEALRKEKDMMDILGHELRTPLGTARNAILMLDSMSKNKTLTDDKLTKYLDIAVENIRREKDMLETILQSARLDSDRLQLKIEPVDLDDAMRDSVTSFAKRAEKKGLVFELEVETGEQSYVLADRTALQQVIDNLVSNAIKYTEKGGLTLFSEFVDDTHIRVGVRDTGEGISKENIEHIGKKFFRANPHLKSEGKIGDRDIVRPGGTGIGMFVVKGLLRAMGTELVIHSELGKGSTFSAVFELTNKSPEKKVVKEEKTSNLED